MIGIKRFSILLLVSILFSFPLASTVVGAVSTGDLVAEYNFDEGSGTILHDISGNGYNGQIHGAQWVSGKYGMALEFDGSNDYVDFSSPVRETPPLTFEVWVKPADIHADIPQYILTNGAEGNGNSGAALAMFTGSLWGEVLDNNKWVFFAKLNDPSRASLTDVTPDWTHLVGVWDVNNNVKLFVNGNLAEETLNGNDNPGAVQNLVMGAPYSKDKGSALYSGLIDEVRIYDKALSDTEVQEIYLSGISNDESSNPTTPVNSEPDPTATPITEQLDDDGDGWANGQEINAGTDPYNVDTDGDGVWDPKDPNPLVSEQPLVSENVFRVEPTVRLRPVVDVIDESQEGLVELYVDNPSLNDVNVNLDVRVSVPSGLHVTGEGFGKAAAAGTVYGTFSIPPGSARTIYVNIQGENVGTYTLQMSGLYWPENNKDVWAPISFTHSFTVQSSAKSIEPVSEESSDSENSPANLPEEKVNAPGFGLVTAIFGILIMFRLRIK